MAVQTVYPSQQQSKSNNPLFARELRRQRLGFMALLIMLGLGLLALQLLPLAARADNPAALEQPAIHMKAPVMQTAQLSKPVRQIKLYNLPSQQD
jgi:hypothetical protein